jgi:hypothetical protein
MCNLSSARRQCGLPTRPDPGRNPWVLYPRAGRSCRAKDIITRTRAEKVIARRLSAIPVDAARPNTLSSRHGVDAFPLHTDHVLAITVPRYILLVAPRERATKTVLFDSRELIREFGEEHLHRSLFLQRSQAGQYVRLLNYSKDRRLFKYNSDVFRPVNSEAQTIQDYIQAATHVTVVDWQKFYMVLIDNWAALHGRSESLDPSDVGLFRFTIWSAMNGLDDE